MLEAIHERIIGNVMALAKVPDKPFHQSQKELVCCWESQRFCWENAGYIGIVAVFAGFLKASCSIMLGTELVKQRCVKRM